MIQPICVNHSFDLIDQENTQIDADHINKKHRRNEQISVKPVPEIRHKRIEQDTAQYPQQPAYTKSFRLIRISQQVVLNIHNHIGCAEHLKQKEDICTAYYAAKQINAVKNHDT